MSDAALTTGSRLGPYEIAARLGAGGMGEVYRARDTKLGRDVAIKILPAAFTADPDRRARFEREARVLASLNHPHIGAIYGFEDAGGVHALVLELVEGETLDARLKASRSMERDGFGRALPIGDALAIARQIADALDAAHERGIVHRDLKPANIVITPDGVVKVLDFGLAKSSGPGGSGGEEQLTHSPTMMAPTIDGVLLGTAPYMSPEQARGKVVDKRTDIWAFGCVLYEMLTGRRPFGGETTPDVIAAILEREPDWTALAASTPHGLQQLLVRCLEKDPRRRLRDIGDARADLDVAGQPPRTNSSGRDRWSWVSILAGAAMAALAVAGWSLFRLRSTGSGAPRIVRALRVTSSAAQEFGPAISPDGKWVAYYSNARGPTDVWVKFLDNGSTLNLTAALGLDVQVRAALSGLEISPDGSRLAFGARESATATYSTWVIPAPIGGAPVKLLKNQQAMRWSPDGTSLATIVAGSTRGDTLIVGNADGSNQREVIPPRGGRHIHWPAWSLDSRFIYFIYTFDTWHTEPSEIYRVSVAGGEPEAVVQSVRRAIYPVPTAGGLIYAANPDSTNLGLWWHPASGGNAKPLTTDVGEYTECRLSADGRHLVCTLLDMKQSLVRVAVGKAPSAQSLTDGYSSDLDPDFSPQGDRIVFSTLRAGSRNLWTMAPDGSQTAPLTSGPSIDERPAYSPDSQQIAFVSDRGGRRGIWVVNAGGGAPRLVGPAVVLDTLSWSPDGSRILFATPQGDLPQPATMSLADGKTTVMATAEGGFAPRLARNGNRIAYFKPLQGRTPALAFMDGQGAALYPQLAAGANFGNAFLAWATDGRRVAAVSMSANANAQIWIVDPDAAVPFQKLLEQPAGIRMRGITWTPDGSSVIFAQQDPHSDIVVFDLERP